MGTNNEIEKTSWGRFIPWVLTVSCIITLITIAFFLIKNIEWYKANVFDIELSKVQEPVYRIQAFHIHISMIKRSVGLFSGFAIMFLGLGVAFFSLRKNTNLEIDSQIWSAKVATASPGIVALLLGGTIIIYTIGSKDDFSSFPVIYEDPTNKANDSLHKKIVPVKPPNFNNQ